MARISVDAKAQLQDLIHHYEKLDRPEAVRRLVESVATAIDAADQPATRFRAYPSTYETLARRGLSWFKVHRYWFGCHSDGQEMVIARVLYDQSNMPRRLRN